MRRLAGLAALAPVLAVVAACGGTQPSGEAVSSPSAAPSETAAATVASCTPSARPAGVPHDEQTAAAFQEPAGAVVNAVERYARALRDSFAGVWLDWQFRGVAAAFTKDLEEHEAALQELATAEIPIRVVEARYTFAELKRIQQALRETGFGDIPWASGIFVVANRVELSLGVVEEDTLARLAEQFPAGGLCVSGPAPDELVPEGPQPQGGAGWRLLADEPDVGTVWDTSVALRPSGYERLWEKLGLAGTPPAVDFDREIVVHFGPAVSGSCSNIRLDGLSVGKDLLLPVFVYPGPANVACTADANAHTYLLAVEQSVLPATPFDIQLETDLPPGAKDSVTIVESLG